jgi:hypothetical protein
MKAANGYAWWSEAFAVRGSERKKERETERFLATLGMRAFGLVEIRERHLNWSGTRKSEGARKSD